MKVPAKDLYKMLEFINVDSINQGEIIVSSAQVLQNKMGVLTGKDQVFQDCQPITGCKMANKNEVLLYESQLVRPYDLWSDKYSDTDFSAIYFEPCSDGSGTKCSEKSKVFGAL